MKHRTPGCATDDTAGVSKPCGWLTPVDSRPCSQCMLFAACHQPRRACHQQAKYLQGGMVQGCRRAQRHAKGGGRAVPQLHRRQRVQALLHERQACVHGLRAHDAGGDVCTTRRHATLEAHKSSSLLSAAYYGCGRVHYGKKPETCPMLDHLKAAPTPQRQQGLQAAIE